MQSRERLYVALVSLVFTWIFFLEYLPPFKTVEIWSDIKGYHHPLLSYAHEALRQGHLPLWDPSIYCGVPFAGNINAALFYPPNWVLFLSRIQSHLSYFSVEVFAIAHVWLAFFLSYLWLRGRTNNWLPAVFGAAVVAFGGYVLAQMNHLGVASGYAWIPLGLRGIDQASRLGSWRPLWQLAAASALCLLAGYPPTWAAGIVVSLAYAVALPGHFRLLAKSIVAIAFSLLLGAVILLPVGEAARLKIPENFFGGGIAEAPSIWLSYLLPNYYDQNRISDGPDISAGPYLYLGAPAVLALFYLLRRPRLNGALPALAIAGAAFWVMINPAALLTYVIPRVPLAGDAVRQFNFLCGPPFAAALLTASALDDFLRRGIRRPVPYAMQAIWAGAALAWTAWLAWIWPRGGADPPAGLASAWYLLPLLILLASGLAIYRATAGPVIAVMLISVVFMDYKAFGSDRRFDAQTSNSDEFFREDVRLGGPFFRGMNDGVFQRLRKEPWARTALVDGPYTTDLRFYGLTTVQGFDPFLPAQYRKAVEDFFPFQTNRLFEVDPIRLDFLDHFGVKYIIVRAGSPTAEALRSHDAFCRLEPADAYYDVYEYLRAKPGWRFDGTAEVQTWTPERRAFRVSSASGGRFVLLEQFFPGWNAWIDGRRMRVDRWGKPFQSVQVEAGAHRVEFVYEPMSLRLGAAVSVISGLALLAAVWVSRPRITG